MKREVTGDGDDRYGHHRVDQLVRKVFIPLIQKGEVDAMRIDAVLRLTRGYFPDLYRVVRKEKKKKKGTKPMPANNETDYSRYDKDVLAKYALGKLYQMNFILMLNNAESGENQAELIHQLYKNAELVQFALDEIHQQDADLYQSLYNHIAQARPAHPLLLSILPDPTRTRTGTE